MQLIKTTIIKAGNGPAVFVAAAQHCMEAGLVRLPCASLIGHPGSQTSCGGQWCWEAALFDAFSHQVFAMCQACATLSLPLYCGALCAPAAFHSPCSVASSACGSAALDPVGSAFA